MNEFKGFEDMHELPDESQCKTSKVSAHAEDIGGVEVPGYVEDCPKCRGSGSWRPGYPCFKCKGSGKLQFKTSPEARGKARKSATKSKAKKAEENKACFLEWRTARPHIDEWFTVNVTNGNSFAMSLFAGGEKYGHLTDGQERAVLNAIARDDEGAEGFKAWCENHEGVLQWLEAETAAGNEFAGSLLSKGKRYGTLTDGQLNAVIRNLEEQKTTVLEGSELDLSDLVKGYYAVPDGDTRLKLCVRRPGKNSRWFGWTFVDDGAGYGRRKTYGKQAPDGLYMGSIQDQLRSILKDPLEAMVAYGKLTGTCGKCGRLLEDEESVAAGIGPICASKM